jgi:polyhydroxybutyrate depolymerase
MRSLLLLLPAVLWLVVAAVGQAVPPSPPPQLPEVAAAFGKVVQTLRVDAAGLVVVGPAAELHRSRHGRLADDTVVPIASASKWLAVATILTLVDDGTLDLDAPAARYVRELASEELRRITLRQCLAHTTGLPARLSTSVRGYDMHRFAAAVGELAQREPSGSVFRYGGVGFQLAAIAAERASGKSWHSLFAERIAAPLGLRHTSFGGLQPIASEPGRAALPWAAGGAVSTLDDYARFVRMLVDGGRFDGVVVLQPDSVRAMCRDQVAHFVDVEPVGFEADGMRYGLGTWLEPLPDGALRASAPGAFGFTPWFDPDRKIGGVFVVQDRVQRVLEALRPLQQTVRTAAVSPQVTGVVETVTLVHQGRERRYLLHVPPHEPRQLGLPLLLALHGGGGNAAQFRDSSGLAAAGNRAGFVVAFVDGTGPLAQKLLTWNSGGVVAYASEHGVDDVGCLRAVVTDVMRRLPIDPSRVFATGHSNGGMMCHRLAREAADLFAGIAVVGGAMDFTAVEATVPIAVLMLHGTADPLVRLEGGAPLQGPGRRNRVDTSMRAAIDYYVARNGLSGYPAAVTDGKVRTETYAMKKVPPGSVPVAALDAMVRVILLEGGGHGWPGSKQRLPGDVQAPFPFDASQAIVDFCVAVAAARSPAAPR